MRGPHEPTLGALRPILPVFLSYALSFVYVGIYWNIRHHLLQATRRVDGAMMWANLHLLFWLSLVPFVTGWMGENQLAPVPTCLYGVVLLMAAVAFYILQRTIIASQPDDPVLARAVGHDLKGKLSPLAYLAAIACTFVEPWISAAIYAAVALAWLVPARRIEREVTGHHNGGRKDYWPP